MLANRFRVLKEGEVSTPSLFKRLINPFKEMLEEMEVRRKAAFLSKFYSLSPEDLTPHIRSAHPPQGVLSEALYYSTKKYIETREEGWLKVIDELIGKGAKDGFIDREGNYLSHLIAYCEDGDAAAALLERLRGVLTIRRNKEGKYPHEVAVLPTVREAFYELLLYGQHTLKPQRGFKPFGER